MGQTARLECAAGGHPTPQIAWQKDGGTDFPAARERRMRVMPDDDVFFIVEVEAKDMGVYSCTATNTAGTVSANATLTVLGKSREPPTTPLSGFPTATCENSRALSWELVSLGVQNEKLYIFLFSAAAAVLQVTGQRSQIRVKGWAVEAGLGLTEGCLLGIPTPFSSLFGRDSDGCLAAGLTAPSLLAVLLSELQQNRASLLLAAQDTDHLCPLCYTEQSFQPSKNSSCNVKHSYTGRVKYVTSVLNNTATEPVC